MAAGEHQTQRVIAHLRLLLVRHGGEGDRGRLAVRPAGLASQPIEGAMPGGGDEPASRRRGNPRARPLFGGDGKGFLNRLLGERQITEEARQDGDRATVFAARYLFNRRVQWGCSMKGRTSMGQVVAAADLRAHASAASRSAALIMVRPPICSLVSTNGPSVITTCPF